MSFEGSRLCWILSFFSEKDIKIKKMSVKKNKTIFCDIDGTIFKYRKFETYTTSIPELLPMAKELVNKWYDSGHIIVLTTARPII